MRLSSSAMTAVILAASMGGYGASGIPRGNPATPEQRERKRQEKLAGAEEALAKARAKQDRKKRRNIGAGYFKG
jgi:hypothetical protein